MVDAIEFTLSGRSTLYADTRQGVNWEAGSPHVLGGKPELGVGIIDGGTTFDVKVGEETPGLSEPQRQWIASAKAASFVLRRHMLLKFISEDPRHRYALLEPFMNLGPFQLIENALKDWSDRLTTSQTGAQATVGDLAQKILRIFEMGPAEAITVKALLDRLNAKLQQLGIAPCTGETDLDRAQKDIAVQLGGADQTARLAALGGLKNELQRLGYGRNISDLLIGLIEAMDSRDREIAARTHEILTDLLVRGKEAIEAAGLDSCPLCEQPIDRASVLQRLEVRIAADARIIAARRLVADRRAELIRHLRPLTGSYRQFVDHWRETIGEPPQVYVEAASLLDELLASLELEATPAQQLREFLPRPATAVADHTETMNRLDAVIAREGGGEPRRILDAAASMIEALMVDCPKYAAAEKAVTQLGRQKEIVSRLHGHAVEARKVAVQGALNDVEKTANTYYETIHPKEAIGTSKLAVRQTGQGSVTLSGTFNGKDENPLLHYSESHLDTLGLCYFLALRRREANKNPIFKTLVLDDVMHSVDADHRARIADLLKEEFADHQIIVTTHDSLFYETLRRAFGNAGYSYYRITNWDLKRGPVLGDPLTDYDRITAAAERERLSQEILASSGGRFFEWMLRELAENLGVAIQARFRRGHDIASLWQPVAKKLKDHRGFSAAHRAVVERLEQNGWVRNECGAHYNEAAAPPTPTEVQEFAASLAELHAATCCTGCGGFVARQQNDNWRCECGTKNYPTRPAA